MNDDRPDDADAGAPASPLTDIEIDLRQELAAAREYVINETFGGPNMYALLEQRNPELKLILNAGIIAGIRQADWIRIGAGWQEEAWKVFRELSE